MEFIKNIVTDEDTIEFLMDILPDRVFIFNKTNNTIYEKYGDICIPLGSETSYSKGEKALHYQGAVPKVSELPKNSDDGSVYYIENDTTTYTDRVVNSLFIKWPDIGYYEVKLNTYTQGEIDKFNSDEKKAREDADKALQDNIDSEAKTRSEADKTLQNNINSEAEAREEADSELQVNLEAESETREEADSTLQSNIESEAFARSEADETLQNNIESEASVRESADIDLDERITQNESDISEIQADLENIDFENNKVVQYAGELTALPTDFSSYKIGTTWKITEAFILNEKKYSAGTFIFKKDESNLDIFTGAGGGSIEEVRVSNDNEPTWVGNYKLGDTKVNGRNILFNTYDSTKQTFSFGHFFLKGTVNVFSFDLMVNVLSGVTQNLTTSGAGPCEVYSCEYNGKQYYTLRIGSDEDFEVYYTGWLSDNFESFSYVAGDLSNFSKIALGELDLNNLPEGSSYNLAPHFEYGNTGWPGNFREFVAGWDFEKYPICYLRPVNIGNTQNATNCDYIYRYTENLNMLNDILGDAKKPVYLILDNVWNMNRTNGNPSEATIRDYINVFFNGTTHPWPGLIGLIMPQDARSNYAGDGSAHNGYFLSNFSNLKYLKLNQTIGARNNGAIGMNVCRNLPALEEIIIPESVTTLDWGADRFLYGCNNLMSIYLPSRTAHMLMHDAYGDLAREFYFRKNSAIYVREEVLDWYLNEWSPANANGSGFLMGKFRVY